MYVSFITLLEWSCAWGHPSGLHCEDFCISWTLGPSLTRPDPTWPNPVLFDGFWGWCIQYAWYFFQGAEVLQFGGGAWSQGGVWTTFSPLAMCPVSQLYQHCSTSAMSLQPSPSRAAKKMACKATGNTRQPCLWVQCVMQCWLHWTGGCLWGRHLSVLPVVSALAAAARITEDPNFTSKCFKCP